MERPPLAPHEVEARVGREECKTIDGWEYSWDGPMMSPPEDWGPCATKDGEFYFATGEPGDPITEKTEWLLC